MIATQEKVILQPRKLFDEVLAILKPIQRPSLIDWMENNYLLKGGTSAVEGYWSREYTPYFVPIAEWLSDTTTREVWIYACSQSGKTTFGTGWEGYIVDVSPGPALMIMPTKPDVQNRVESRIRPMFAENENLLRHVGGRVKNIFIGKQTVMDHMILYIGWPTTPQALADKPVCFILADETGKYPAIVGEEADPISLMRKRQRWFKGRSKLLGMTTPIIVGDMSDQEWNKGDCCEFWVPCELCGKWHLLAWENVRIERNKSNEFYDAEEYKKGKYAAYYCPHCDKPWTEEQRWKAVCKGKFVPGDMSLDEDGRLIGQYKSTSYKSCRIHALMLHPMVETTASLTAEFVNAHKAMKAGNIQPYKDFWNNQLSRAWEERQETTDIQRLKSHIGSYEKGIVPVGVEMLIAAMDVQLDHVWLMVFGFGYLGECWTIFEQRVETGPTDRVENLEKLLPYLTIRFPLIENKTIEMQITLSVIDVKYNADSVKAFCVRCIGVVPIVPVAGDDKLTKQLIRVSRESSGLINVYHLNTCAWKDMVYRKYFESTEPGPGYGHFHKDTEYIVLQHFCAEEKVIERKGDKISWIGWKLKKLGLDNHYGDDAYYAQAGAEIAGVWNIPNPETVTQAPPKVSQKKEKSNYDHRARL